MRCGERWIVTPQLGQRDCWICTLGKTTRRGAGLLEFRVYITYSEMCYLKSAFMVVSEIDGVLWLGDANLVRSRRPRDSGTDLRLKTVMTVWWKKREPQAVVRRTDERDLLHFWDWNIGNWMEVESASVPFLVNGKTCSRFANLNFT